MAKKTWFRMRAGLLECQEVHRMSNELDIDPDAVVVLLYRVASWFAESGDYGVVRCNPSVIDRYAKTDGLAESLGKSGWLIVSGDSCMLREFTNVSALRKSIGRKMRQKVLSSGKCAHCGSADRLEIDHIIPVSRGGKTELQNLQPLCKPCNLRKGVQ